MEELQRILSLSLISHTPRFLWFSETLHYRLSCQGFKSGLSVLIHKYRCSLVRLEQYWVVYSAECCPPGIRGAHHGQHVRPPRSLNIGDRFWAAGVKNVTCRSLSILGIKSVLTVYSTQRWIAFASDSSPLSSRSVSFVSVSHSVTRVKMLHGMP